MKKISANKPAKLTVGIAEPKKLARSYWLMKVTGETQHCLWRGKLEYGIPPYDELAKLIGVNYVERVLVMYKGKRCSMFLDEAGKLREQRIFNWKASALYANMSLINSDLQSAVYSDLLEDPPVPPLVLVEHRLVIIGTAVLWESEFDDNAGNEDALPSIMEKLRVKL